MINSEITAYYNSKEKTPLKNTKVSIFLDKKDKKPTLNIDNQNKFGEGLDWGMTAFLSNKNAVLNCAYDILFHYYNEDIAQEFCYKFAKEMLKEINVSIFVLTASDIDRWLVDLNYRV